MTNEPTRLEDLSDELFLYIFSFIRAKDLVEGWCKLNKHIDAIIRSVPISIEIKNNDDIDDCFPSLQYFCSQIFYLKDDRYYPDIEIDVRSLVNIRSLYLMQYSNRQYKSIDPDYQPRLTRFFSLSAPWSFYERILFGEIRFPYLISIGYLRGASILLLNLSNCINRTIRNLHLYSISNEILCKYLQYFPNTISLTIDYFYSNNFSSSTLSLTNCSVHYLTIKHWLSSQLEFDQLLFSLGYSNLIYLCVLFNTCDFKELSNIIRKLSSIQHFKLKVETYPSDLDLITIRLMSPWFLSLNYGYIIEENKSKQILFINTSRKQMLFLKS